MMELASMSRIRAFPVFVSLFVATAAFAANPELPSAGLEDRVDFWRKVYTQYGENDIVIHDAFRVNLIYNIATEDNLNSNMAAVRDTLREIRDKVNTPEEFGPEAKSIAEAIVAH